MRGYGSKTAAEVNRHRCWPRGILQQEIVPLTEPTQQLSLVSLSLWGAGRPRCRPDGIEVQCLGLGFSWTKHWQTCRPLCPLYIHKKGNLYVMFAFTNAGLRHGCTSVCVCVAHTLARSLSLSLSLPPYGICTCMCAFMDMLQ